MQAPSSIIDLFINEQVLSFGQFTLKSGRSSPYFFNLGNLCSGLSMAALGGHYADKLIQEGLTETALFGPAYKGIPLVTATAVALSQKTNIRVPFAYNRKEVKDHGEGGLFVGAMGKQVVVIDDVISAGATAQAMIQQLKGQGVQCVAWLVGLDRQERGKQGSQMASVWLAEETGVPVSALIGFDDILDYVEGHSDFEQHAESMRAYREQYGVL